MNGYAKILIPVNRLSIMLNIASALTMITACLSSGCHRNALFSIGLVLFLFIMLINVFLNVFIKRKKED